jgi:hypothetical protein
MVPRVRSLRGPIGLALRARRIRWASVKRRGLPASCSNRIRFSSCNYSMIACWWRLTQPVIMTKRTWSCTSMTGSQASPAQVLQVRARFG